MMKNVNHWRKICVAVFVAGFLAFVGTSAYSAGELQETRSFTDTLRRADVRVNRIVLRWTSDGSGNVSAVQSQEVTGTIMKVQFVPAGGDLQPTDLYDVTVTDGAGVDVLAGRGANLSNSAASAVCPAVSFSDGTITSIVPTAVAEQLTVNVSNAGASNAGSVILFVR